MDSVNDSVIIPSANDTLRIIFLGNSITLHGIVEDMLPCKAERGMMATSPQKDYVHQVSTHLAVSNQLNVKFSIINIASFERSFPEHSFDIKLLSKAMVSSPDILVVQIGENVSEESIQDPALFEKRYTELLNLFPNSIRFITIPFWPSMQKQYAITNVAIRSKSYLVDLSHLGDGTDMTNFASSYKRYKMPGVGAHPGDIGMKHISDCIYADINAIINQKSHLTQ